MCIPVDYPRRPSIIAINKMQFKGNNDVSHAKIVDLQRRAQEAPSDVARERGEALRVRMLSLAFNEMGVAVNSISQDDAELLNAAPNALIMLQLKKLMV